MRATPRTGRLQQGKGARGAFDGYQTDQPLSFDRYLRGLATARWDGAEHERALAEATVGAGGSLVPSPLASWVIDLARNRTVVLRAGAQTVAMTSQTLALARLTSEGTPAWKTEGANITAADMVFDRVTFTARTLVRLIQPSVELFEDADPSSEGIIARSFRRPDGGGARPGGPPGDGHRARAPRGAEPVRRDPDRPRRRRLGDHQLRLVAGRHRRGAGGRVRAHEPHPGALVLGDVDSKGHGSRTLITSGDPIPPELAQLPRAPARAPSRKR